MCVCFWGMEMRQYSSIRSKNVGDIFRLFSHIRLFLSNPAYLQSNQVMGWGEKAIELRSANTGNLEGVFMHKKAQKLKFLCERNDKVGGTYDKKQPRFIYAPFVLFQFLKAPSCCRFSLRRCSRAAAVRFTS